MVHTYMDVISKAKGGLGINEASESWRDEGETLNDLLLGRSKSSKDAKRVQVP